MLRLFPVSGGANFTNDFGDGRSGGRKHEGNDLFADEGTPLLAVDDGEARFGVDGLGGNVVNLFANDGTRYYYAHLSAFQDADVGTHKNVKAGDVLGFVGTTGNAQGTPSHLHFEIHPGNGKPVNPFPLLQDAPLTTAGASSGGKSLILPILVAAGVGLAAWAYMNPKPAKALVRRVTG